jgi:hypothetical protein
MDHVSDDIDPVGATIALTLVRERRFLGLPIRLAGVITRAWRRFIRLSRWLIPLVLVWVEILLKRLGSGWRFLLVVPCGLATRLTNRGCRLFGETGRLLISTRALRPWWIATERLRRLLVRAGVWRRLRATPGCLRCPLVRTLVVPAGMWLIRSASCRGTTARRRPLRTLILVVTHASAL